MFPCTLGRHSALTASSLWATVGAKYMSTCQTETSISGAVMLVYSRVGRGGSPKTCGKTSTSHTAVSRNSPPPTQFNLGDFLSSFEAHVKKHLWVHLRWCRKVRVKLKRWQRAASLFPLERTGVKHLHHRSFSARQIHSLKISSSIHKIKATADKPERITVCEFTPSQTHVRN